MVLKDSSSDDEVSEMKEEESLSAHLMGFGMCMLIESGNRIKLRR